MKRIISNITKRSWVALCLLCLAFASCNDLDQIPHEDLSGGDVFNTVEGCNSALAKVYASYVIVGQSKGSGNDFSTNSGHDTMRGYINLQELPTDEMAATWLSGEKQDGLTYMQWDENDPWVSDVYYRLYYTIALANNFLINTKDNSNETVKQYRAEARYLRALAYYMVLDLYGKGPFVDENTGIGGYMPEAYSNRKLFGYIEKELTELATLLPDKGKVEYPRASSGACYALLAKLYLNAKSYGLDLKEKEEDRIKYNEYLGKCIDACNKLQEMGYTVEGVEYASLFNADNHKRTNEIIFAFAIDGKNTVSWGATTYLVCGAVGNTNNQDASKYGVASGWSSFRMRGELAAKFEDDDIRGGATMIYKDDSEQYFSGNPIDNQKYGYFGTKFTNLTDEGETASNTADGGVCTDYIVLRYADVLLMKAEATKRLNPAADVTAILQPLYNRAFPETSPNRILVDSKVDLDFILDERARELWWESTRRTDLVRFDKFTTGDYLWEWKGKKAEGRAVDASYNTYPIPYAETTANPNLK